MANQETFSEETKALRRIAGAIFVHGLVVFGGLMVLAIVIATLR